jgi:hypothetical protein
MHTCKTCQTVQSWNPLTDDKCDNCREAEHTQALTRLEYLRNQINQECISYGEIAELESLADHIEPGDVQLLEWAGVKEN